MMKKIIQITIAVIFLVLIFTSCSMYSRIPKISILTSKGILFNNEIFYIMNYQIYRRPEGVMKFPDGGLAKDIINEFYIVKYQNIDKENKLVYKLNIDDGLLKLNSVKVSEGGGEIYFLLKYKDKNSEWREELYITNPVTGKIIVKTKDSKKVEENIGQNIISTKSTSELVRFIYDYDKLGLKNPLDFMEINDKNLKEVLLHDKYNGRMHLAVIYYIIKNNRNELLAEIENKNSDKYIIGYINYIKGDWSVEQLKEYMKKL